MNRWWAVWPLPASPNMSQPRCPAVEFGPYPECQSMTGTWMSGRERKLGFRTLGGDGVDSKVTPGRWTGMQGGPGPLIRRWGWRAHVAPVTGTVSPLPAAKAQEVLQAIRGYVRFFFGCRDCASHFEQMAAASMHRVESLNSAVLWLWSSHNKVNARLAGKEGPPPRPESPTEGEGGGGVWGTWTRDRRLDARCPRGNPPCVTVRRALPHALPALRM